MKRRRSSCIVSVFLVTLALVSCGKSGSKSSTSAKGTDSPQQGKTYSLRLGHEGQGPTHPYQYGAEQFARLVAEKTNGAVTIQVYGNASLGTQKEMVEMVYTGTLDIVENVFSVFESYNSNIGSLVLPFMFDSLDHYWACMDGELGKKIAGWLSERGFTMLSVFQNGEIGLESKYPVKAPKDVKGLKFRAPDGQVANAVSKRLGLNGTSLALSELYSAFQLGTIECASYQVPNVYSYGLYEVAPHFCELNYQIMGEPLTINTKVFKSLPEQYQTALVEAAHEAAVLQREYSQKSVKGWKDEMSKKGATFYRPAGSELAQWKDVMNINDQFPQWKDVAGLVKSIKY